QLHVDRTGLAPGSYSGTFDIVAGDSNISIALNLQVPTPPPPPALAVSPTAFNFGLASVSGPLTVTNAGGGTVNWTASEDIPWLNLTPSNGSVAAGEDGDVVTITADRDDLDGGTHTGTIHFTSAAGNVDVDVSVQVPQQAPALVLSPADLDFGVSTTTTVLNVTNAGSGDLTWQLSEDIPWLTLSAESGTLPTASFPVTVTVDRSGLDEGEHNGQITATSNGGNATVDVQLVVAPPALNVTPLTLQFGSSATNKLLAIENVGSGSLDWAINTSAFPTWLRISQDHGTVGATATPIVVTCDRTGVAKGTHSHEFEVQWDKGAFTVTANMSVATQPVLTVDSGFVNKADEPLAPLGTELDFMNVTIRNTGSGTLDWSFDTSTLPEWLSITPQTGTAILDQINVVRVSVDRTGLSSGGYIHRIPLNSNAQDIFLEVSMQVPLRPDIGVDPTELRLGVDSDIGVAFVANTGDANTLLSFKVESDTEWLFFSPRTSTSIGTAGPIKDWKRINVAVDRSLLETDGGTGILTITAIDGAGNPLRKIPSQTITVSVEAPGLSFEVGKAQISMPSLVRFGFIMRDVKAAAIFTDPVVLQNQDAFRLFEDGVEIEQAETSWYVQSWERLKVNMVLLLDISGSMQNAVTEAGMTGPEPLLQLYRDTCAPFLQSLPPTWKVSLMEFHERRQPDLSRVIHDFTYDRDALIQALQGHHVLDYGATELLPAVLQASQSLIDEDPPIEEEIQDDADLRIALLITDGRRTTPPGDIDDASDILFENYARVYSVGWGQDIDHEPLARLASKTGGRYYSTRPDANAHARRSELERALQAFSTDMRALRMLGYTTLNEGEQTELRVTGFFNPPEDTPDRGVIQGTFSQQAEPSKHLGNNLAGQIFLLSDGIDAEGNARAYIHAEYIPRGISQFNVTIASSAAYDSVSLVPRAEGGLLEGWDLIEIGEHLYSVTAPAGQSLPYGAFGEFIQVDYVDAQQPITLQVIVATLHGGAPGTPYFKYPDALTINFGEPSRAVVAPDL
ncbi:MAG: VWA domain-containing protein, partial [FCB group bacterium]|nr:VWA domain-containing protein [FCB group bacterium]